MRKKKIKNIRNKRKCNDNQENIRSRFVNYSLKDESKYCQKQMQNDKSGFHEHE